MRALKYALVISVLTVMSMGMYEMLSIATKLQ